MGASRASTSTSNSVVKKRDVLAEIDPTLYGQQVTQVRGRAARSLRAREGHDGHDADHAERVQKLYAELASRPTSIPRKGNYDVAVAAVNAANASINSQGSAQLVQSVTNVGFTKIEPAGRRRRRHARHRPGSTSSRASGRPSVRHRGDLRRCVSSRTSTKRTWASLCARRWKPKRSSTLPSARRSTASCRFATARTRSRVSSPYSAGRRVENLEENFVPHDGHRRSHVAKGALAFAERALRFRSPRRRPQPMVEWGVSPSRRRRRKRSGARSRALVDKPVATKKTRRRICRFTELTD